MYLENPELAREMGQSHLEDLIAEAAAERRARQLTVKENNGVSTVGNLLNWLANWRKTTRRFAPKGI